MDTLVERFKALGDNKRLKILTLLSESELCVCEIMEKTSLSQSVVSHHLKLLKNIKLIKSRKAGKWIFYSIDEENIKDFYKEVDNILRSFSKTPFIREDFCEDCDKIYRGGKSK